MENTLVAVPQERPESISEILNTLKRYDALVIKDLQEYLESQISGNFQDLSSNLALLKLYELVNSELDSFTETENHTVQVLLKGLINFNYSDFQLYLNLLPSYTIVNERTPFVNSLNEKVQKLLQVYNVLVSAKFREFWTIFNTDAYFQNEIASKHFDSVANLKYEFQRSIALLVSITYKLIDLRYLQTILDFDKQEDLQNFVADLKWTTRDGKAVVSGADAADEDKILNINTETIKFEQINRLIKKAYEN